MFALRLGVTEDPATGSAAASFTGLAAQTLPLGDGEHRLTIEQGYEMGRPSLIELRVPVADAKLTSARIGGAAVIVTLVMHLEWIFAPTVVILVLMLALTITLAAGFVGTWRLLGRSAAAVLRAP